MAFPPKSGRSPRGAIRWSPRRWRIGARRWRRGSWRRRSMPRWWPGVFAVRSTGWRTTMRPRSICCDRDAAPASSKRRAARSPTIVETAGGRAQTLRSVAPTEWNFHPAGPFMAALARAPRVADPIFAARLLAASFDPCVPFRIEASARPSTADQRGDCASCMKSRSPPR